MLYPFELTLLSIPHLSVGELLLSFILFFYFPQLEFRFSISVLPGTAHLFPSFPLPSLLAKITVQMCCSLTLLVSCSLFLLCFDQALFLLQSKGQHWLLWVIFKPPPFSSISGSSSVVGVVSLGSYVVAHFLFPVLSTSSPCVRCLRTPMRVRGEDRMLHPP